MEKSIREMTFEEFMQWLIEKATMSLYEVMGDKFLELSFDEQNAMVHDLIMTFAKNYIDKGFEGILGKEGVK